MDSKKFLEKIASSFLYRCLHDLLLYHINTFMDNLTMIYGQIRLSKLDRRNIFVLIEGRYSPLISPNSATKIYRFRENTNEKYIKQITVHGWSHTIFYNHDIPTRSLSNFITKISKVYPYSDMKQFIKRYMEIFEISESDADIITELI